MKVLPLEYAVRNLGRSPVRLALSVLGSALVVGLVMAAGAFVRGMEASLGASGSADNVLLLSAGSEESVERSEIPPAAAGDVAAGLRGVRSRLGVPYVSPEVHVMLEVRAAKEGSPRSAVLRGVTPAAFLVHGRVRIVEGRAPEAGRDELMAGALADARLGGRLEVGSKLWIDGRPLAVVGRFEAPGTVLESELWAPLSDLQLLTRRQALSCVVLTLDDGTEFEDVDAFCKQRLDLALTAIPERGYYGRLADLYAPVRAMVWATAALIALGGLLGGLNTMYAAFAGRVREVGTLQAIGFPRRAVVLSLVQESALTTAAGALFAAALGVALLDGLAVRFSMGAFALRVDATVLTWSLGCAAALGVLGALPPAWRCLRLPVADALKAV